ncbi:MAG: hypothetical protein DMG12_12455 [Acidobacteria bacterium]|nr:MAG: hypothetical protein DMG12_12455 [Acidobacteriota bacterium]
MRLPAAILSVKIFRVTFVVVAYLLNAFVSMRAAHARLNLRHPRHKTFVEALPSSVSRDWLSGDAGDANAG